MLHPLPRCAITTRPAAAAGSSARRAWVTYSKDSPWKPYRRTPASNSSRGSAYSSATRGAVPVERGVEAGHLGQIGPGLGQRADGGQVVGLVRGGERFETGQDCQHPLIDHHRLGVDRSAMHHAMTDRQDLQARAVVLQPVEEVVYRVFLRRNFSRGEIRIRDARAALDGDEVGGGPDPLELAPG